MGECEINVKILLRPRAEK